jgi:type IV pilus assembly protein PilQ
MQMIIRKYLTVFLVFGLMIVNSPAAFSQENDAMTGEDSQQAQSTNQDLAEKLADVMSEEADSEDIEEIVEAYQEGAEEAEEGEGAAGPPTNTENVSLDFREADVKTILRVLSLKSGVNIVAGPDVAGPITIRLEDVPWQTALDVILKTYGYGYERSEGVIIVTPLEKLTAAKAEEQKLAEVQPVEIEVFKLSFIDASDAKKVLEPQLSPRGKITVLALTGQKGWSFGTRVGPKVGGAAPVLKMPERTGADAQEKADMLKVRSKILIVSDIPPHLEKIRKVLSKIDRMPKQILIEAKIAEINRDKLEDLGFDWGLGSSNSASETGITTTSISNKDNVASKAIGGHILGSQVTPSIFGPKASITSLTGTEPFEIGAQFVFEKLTGTQFQAIIHALAEDVDANVLSAPRVVTLDNQEANIVVAELVPILAIEAKSTEEGIMTAQTLDYYENVGVQLFVIPQISGEEYINMIIHPVVTSVTDSKTATASAISSGGSVSLTTDYPFIDLRETETQVLIKDGETVVIGGLLKDIWAENEFKVPILGDIPLIGELFKRTTTDIEKVDLLVFLSARIINSPEEAARMDLEMREMRVTMPSQSRVVISGEGIVSEED